MNKRQRVIRFKIFSLLLPMKELMQRIDSSFIFKCMKPKKKEFFTSRWGYVLSLMGVAIGAGNIWRFSRVVAQNGGGSFIIPWVIFLFIWSIPLIIAEIAMGKLTRKAPIGALASTAGKKMGWMGAFVALVSTGILFYYSVVVGWGFSYFFYSISGKLTTISDHHILWDKYSHSFTPLYFHTAAILIGCLVIYKGVVKGIERSNKILIPSLLIIILIISIRAVTLPGSWEGIKYLFTPHFADLLNYRVWIEALTQNAWDTGAGWGLLLVYSGYARRDESITVNGCLTAFSNNAVSLLMGVTIFATAFALESHSGILELIKGEGSTNTGLTFIYLPELFRQLPGGSIVHAAFASIFFLAFSFAALSSMISMVQMTSQTFHELGLSRNKAIGLTGALTLFLGAPSAINMAFFNNQDWVWSVGLIVSGLFIAYGAIRYGVNRYREEAINTSPHDFKLGKSYNFIIGVLIPAQAVTLICWYFYQSLTQLNDEWWNPFGIYSLGTILFQWGVALIFFIAMNKWLVRKTMGQ
jgi:NSS family neurotransmitter:Na+ symporter